MEEKAQASVGQKAGSESKKPWLNFALVGILFLLAGAAIGHFVFPKTGLVAAPVIIGGTAGLDSGTVSEKTIKYLNDNFFSSQGLTAKIGSVSEKFGLYDIVCDIFKGSEKQGSFTVFVSKDSKIMLAGAQVFDLDVPVPRTEPQEPAVEAAKSDKPKAELFVMSFCPYGIVAEKALSPVVGLLKDKADISVHFIATVSGETAESVQSLHGANEAMEDLRQICIAKEYGTNAFWKYVGYINTNCSSNYRDSSALDACWKKAAEDAGIDAAKIEACSKSKDALELLKADNVLTDKYGVSGSPTLVINGTVTSPERTPEGFKQTICNAFNNAPAECDQQLSASSETPAGNCG